MDHCRHSTDDWNCLLGLGWVVQASVALVQGLALALVRVLGQRQRTKELEG
jgi:hypothetical protein